jgi:hypothetical protein
MHELLQLQYAVDVLEIVANCLLFEGREAVAGKIKGFFLAHHCLPQVAE